MIKKNIIVILFIIFALFGGIFWFLGGKPPHMMEQPKQAMVDVKIPSQFSMRAKSGQQKFANNCQICHGKNAAGNEGAGPPLIHKIYEPNHHSDESFYRAVKGGVRAHHWRFGNMPPVENVKRKDVTDIIAYIRELQKANGIY